MKLRAFENCSADVYFRLVNGGNKGGGVRLIVVDDQGEELDCGDILSITGEGIVLYAGFSSEFGIATDGGYVKVQREYD